MTSTLAVVLLMFDRQGERAIPVLGSNPTAFLLPLFFWAGVRLGVSGICGVMLVYATIASQAAVAGRRPFDWLPPDRERHRAAGVPRRDGRSDDVRGGAPR